jgi:hypothetical protein
MLLDQIAEPSGLTLADEALRLRGAREIALGVILAE